MMWLFTGDGFLDENSDPTHNGDIQADLGGLIKLLS